MANRKATPSVKVRKTRANTSAIASKTSGAARKKANTAPGKTPAMASKQKFALTPTAKKPPVKMPQTATKMAMKKPVAKPKAKPVAMPAAKPVAKPAAKPVAKPAAKPVAKPKAKPVAKPAAKPVAMPTAKPVAMPTAKPVAKTTAKPVAKTTAKPVAMPTAKSVPKPVAKPIAKPAAKPLPAPVAKQVAKLVVKPVPAPVAKPVAKPTPAPVAKPAAKSVPAPAAKPVATPVAKLVAKALPKPVAKPAPAPVAKPSVPDTSVNKTPKTIAKQPASKSVSAAQTAPISKETTVKTQGGKLDSVPNEPVAMNALVLWAASEAVPWAATGGLGDVAGSLPSVLRKQGWDVRLILPAYATALRKDRTHVVFEFRLPEAPHLPITVLQADDPPGGVPTYLIGCGHLFDREGVYGDAFGPFGDNPYRFGIFQLAIRDLAARLERPVSILHLHDWHTGILPALLQVPGQRAANLSDTRTIFTIHNLQFQGETGRDLMDALSLPPVLWNPAVAEHFGMLVPIKAAIRSSDIVTTVSPTYSNEIRERSHGFGLDGELRGRGPDVRGLLNGIDTTSWDANVDPALAAKFSAENPAGRALCRKALQTEFGIPNDDAPLVAFVGRLTYEKGVDLIANATPHFVKKGCRVLILGTGNPELEARVAALGHAYPEQVRAIPRFDPALSRRMFAGADILLVPSQTEPCGLVQFYALRYGAIPVVHSVGGLRDTITEGVNGFRFEQPTPESLSAAVDRALALFADKKRWTALQAHAMAEDWSWERSAQTYAELYREVLAVPAAEPAWSKWSDELGSLEGAKKTPTVRLMIHSARSLFVYWDGADSKASDLELLIEERPGGTFFSSGGDLPCSGRRWLAVRPERMYRAILRNKSGAVLAISNAAATPRAGKAARDVGIVAAQVRAAIESGAFENDPEGTLWARMFSDSVRFTRTTASNGLQVRAGTETENFRVPLTLEFIEETETFEEDIGATVQGTSLAFASRGRKTRRLSAGPGDSSLSMTGTSLAFSNRAR